MYTDRFGRKLYKVGLHAHTTRSDGRKTPAEVAEIYKAAGYDAIALTDHWFFQRDLEINGLTVISGAEYNLGGSDSLNRVTHILGLGMKTDPCLVYGEHSEQEVINAIGNCGGRAVLAHPFWSLNTPEDALALDGIFATEIYNTVSDAHESFRPESGYFVDLLANRGVAYPLLATDDSHYYDGTDNCVSYVMVEADDCDPDAILDAIAAGRSYATQGPELMVTTRPDGSFGIDCSPVDELIIMSNLVWRKNRCLRQANLTHADFVPQENEKWIRIEARDKKNGLTAWSNVYFIK